MRTQNDKDRTSPMLQVYIGTLYSRKCDRLGNTLKKHIAKVLTFNISFCFLVTYRYGTTARENPGYLIITAQKDDNKTQSQKNHKRSPPHTLRNSSSPVLKIGLVALRSAPSPPHCCLSSPCPPGVASSDVGSPILNVGSSSSASSSKI